MKKKVLALLLASTMMVASLTGCGKTTADPAASTSTGSTGTVETPAASDLTFDIKVWAPDKAVALTEKQIADFNATNTDGITLNATVEAISEADAATNMINDVESGADIFFFAQDQAARLVQAGALSKLGNKAQEIVSEANDAGVVAAATSGEEMYAYPLTSDNGFFMYYDKSVVKEENIKSLEAIVADCEAAGKTFCMETETSAWYIASFFFATGCDSTWVTGDDGSFISVNDTFNSDKGLIACQGMYHLVSSPIYVSSSKAAEFEAAIPAAVVVSGTWDVDTAKSILGDNMGVAELPYFEVDGQKYHMGSYNGCKLLGVKPQTDAAKSASIHKLAQYLTSEEGQMERFNELGWGPANKNAQASDAVQSDPTLSALFAQNQYSVPQGQIEGSWWDTAKVIGTDVKESKGDLEAMKAGLQKYDDALAAVFSKTAEEKEAWSVIGAVMGSNWDTDFNLEAQGDGIFKLANCELKAGDEFKVRQGASWTINYGADGALDGPNIAVEADGTYTIVFDANTGLITLE